jgi:hypothetical protein
MGMHEYYYLYGLERAGVLLLAPKFGEHDWYDDGSRLIIGAQAGDGSWDAGDAGTVGPTCDTCFAILFLARGTTPLVRIPTRTATGEKGQPQPAPQGQKPDAPKPDAPKPDAPTKPDAPKPDAPTKPDDGDGD